MFLFADDPPSASDFAPSLWTSRCCLNQFLKKYGMLEDSFFFLFHIGVMLLLNNVK